ncbi:NADPH2:quinone reductase [Granulicella pectinivorans]|uniref:NADPH2:quinone reductase n=1 Tax=Granulicella pectinivorans TaxID=474950 RepID=A0A1I6MZB8_9BACT|nr:zinc-binding alcohol dehydrogenase family protein [Granulicella pectinivorans]SFS21024.1 NADPH2:quinone reductase [Granulicella pectinivorans]
MKAAIVLGMGQGPVYGEFREPVAGDGEEIVTVMAAALSPFSKARSTGSHYSSEDGFPVVAGADGVGRTADGRRVYFALPEAPFGAMAERTVVDARRCVAVPDGLDDVTAAAIANPGMSAWAALMERAKMQAGETVLVHGATGTAGRLAVQLARYFGAGKVIATGRNVAELETVGADVVVPLGAGFEDALVELFAGGIDVVIDYLWGESAKAIMVAIVKAVEDGRPVRFVHVGAAAGEMEIALPGAALRSSAMVLMGSGLKSVPMRVLLGAIAKVFAAVEPAGLTIATRRVPLAEVEAVWREAAGRPRVVFTVG